jgi:hypothetical protein
MTRIVTALICIAICAFFGSPIATAGDHTRVHGTRSSDSFSLIGNRAMAAVRHQSASTRGAQAGQDFAGVASHGVVAGTSGSTSTPQLHILPMLSGVFFSNGQRLCGGGRNPVPCSPAAAAAGTPVAAAAGPAAPPQVTPGQVLTELRRIGLPSLKARTQPKDKTLVNFDTIFFTTPHTITRSITLLGQPVQVEATPDSFTWHYGDGDSNTTADPGAPYPSKDITHKYFDAHVTVRPSVDVTYSGRFRVGDGPWQVIPGTVTIPGPGTPLRISEATPVLSGNY